MYPYHYECDCGDLVIGSSACKVHIANNFGDGAFRLLVFGSREEAGGMEGWAFVTVCEGDAMEVYGYDCEPADVLCTLSGKYAVYRRKDECGDMALVRWS